ncbi:MAG: putative cytosine deaminase [Actinomycetota bacterium]
MTQLLRLQSATTPTGDVVDITVNSDTGLISAIDQAGSTHTNDASVLEMNAYIVSSGLVEPHAHLDKAFLADRVHNPEGDLMGAIVGLEAIRSTITFDDIVERATRAAVTLSRNGVTSVRTHADVTLTGGLAPLLALLETKRRCASFIDIQVAMLLEWPLTGPGSEQRHALARDAIAAGAEVVGGCPHLDDDPIGAVAFLLTLAEEHNLPLDLHADENLRPSSQDLLHVASLALERKPSIAINASHCVSLSVHTPEDARRIADKVAEANISVTVLPQTNLFLQSRDNSTHKARAIAPVDILRQAGVLVAAGADNVQDPFNPVGRIDPLETASLLVMAAHQTTAHAFDMVTHNASTVVHGTQNHLEVGHRADLVAVRAANIREAIAMGPADRIVIKNGRIVALSDYAKALNNDSAKN